MRNVCVSTLEAFLTGILLRVSCIFIADGAEKARQAKEGCRYLRDMIFFIRRQIK